MEKDFAFLKNARGPAEGLLADLDLGPDLAAAPGPEAGMYYFEQGLYIY